MKNKLLAIIILVGVIGTLSSCSKDNDSNPSVKPYTVPATYSFSNANYIKSTQRAKMTIELDNYLRTANPGTALIPLDQVKVNNMFNNTGNAFADANLNTSGI